MLEASGGVHRDFLRAMYWLQKGFLSALRGLPGLHNRITGGFTTVCITCKIESIPASDRFNNITAYAV